MDKHRKAMYAKIHIARKQLPHLDDDTYRGILQSNFKIDSITKLNMHQLAILVQDLAKLGAEYTAPAKANNNKVKPHARPDWIEVPEGSFFAREKRKICALWKELGYSMTSLETRVKREFGAASLLWLKDEKHILRLLADLEKRLQNQQNKGKENYATI